MFSTIETLELASAPVGEDCVQLSKTDDYLPAMRAECKAFGELLIAIFGEGPNGARFVIKSNAHDFGTYLEVAVKFDAEDEEAAEWAYNIEGNLPETWIYNGKDYRPAADVQN